MSTTKSKYLLMKDSSVYTDDSGNSYPDIFSFPTSNFEATENPQKYALAQEDIERFDVLISSYYGNANYDQYVLWFNNIGHIADEEVGTEIYLPSKTDLDNFISNNLQ